MRPDNAHNLLCHFENKIATECERLLYNSLRYDFYISLVPLRNSLVDGLREVEKELDSQLLRHSPIVPSDVAIEVIHAVFNKLFQTARDDLGLKEYDNQLLLLSRGMCDLLVNNFSGEIGDVLSDDLWNYGES